MDSTHRFSSRVEDYVKYRPGYPSGIVEYLNGTGSLAPTSIVADIGCGTGLLAELFLRNGNRVIGIEPNRDMRLAGEKQLAQFPNFTSIDGTAEATTLPDASVDWVVAGQAFHWFDREKTAVEFRRILRVPKSVALIWNERLTDTTRFLRDYEKLLQEFSTDYNAVDHRRMTDEVIGSFFKNGFKLMTFANQQVFDFEGVKGRLLSSSYAPTVGHPRHEAMLAKLADDFTTHQQDGRVTVEYETKVYMGTLA